jgi:hypothetical protein
MAGNSLIFYGLGNFLHQGTADITGKGICRDYGLMARVHLKREPNGKLELRAVEAIPVTDTHFRPRRLTGEAGAAHIYALNYLSADLGDGAKAQGVLFTPQEDGTGLYCRPGAEHGRRQDRRAVQGVSTRAAHPRQSARDDRWLVQPLTSTLRPAALAG